MGESTPPISIAGPTSSVLLFDLISSYDRAQLATSPVHKGAFSNKDSLLGGSLQTNSVLRTRGNGRWRWVTCLFNHGVMWIYRVQQ